MQELGMFYDLITPALVALLVSLIVYAGLARKVWTLQCDLASTQAQLLRERNQRASLSRSKDKEALEVLSELGQHAPTPTQRHPLAKFGISK